MVDDDAASDRSGAENLDIDAHKGDRKGRCAKAKKSSARKFAVHSVVQQPVRGGSNGVGRPATPMLHRATPTVPRNILRALVSEAAVCGERSYSQDAVHLSAALSNTGVKAGGGGRSSVSGVIATAFGSAGFLGRYVANMLARQGSQIVYPHRCDELNVQHLKVMGDLGQMVALSDFDVRDEALIRKAVSQSNVVINLIGAEFETPRFSFEDVHVTAARRIAEAAKAIGAERLVHVSCLGASEDAPSKRLRTKALGEKAVLEVFPEATIVRPSVMIGTEDRFFNEYAKLAKLAPLVPLPNGGQARLQPVYVRDVASGIVEALKSKTTEGKVIELAGPKVYTRKQLLELTYETIREKYGGVYTPLLLMTLAAKPREWLLKRGLGLPIPTMFTEDYLEESVHDLVLEPASGVLTFSDLGIEPKAIDVGLPIEHVRHYRVGGYELGTEDS